MPPAHFDSPDSFLALAAKAAWRASGLVEPNPLVGAVLVSPSGNLLAIGHHQRFGTRHAEVAALESCRAHGIDPAGSTLYVTLEPCNAPGRNPPCTQAIIAARIARVVYARPDPNPAKAGGAATLAAAGIAVECRDHPSFARGISDPFIKNITTSLPWVIAKWAQTIDGRIATRRGESKWISNERSRRRVHRIRARVDAILTGIGTVLADDPLLTARGVSLRRHAKRIIADSDLSIPLTAQLAQPPLNLPPTLIACDAATADSPLSASKRTTLESRGITIIPVPAASFATNPRGIDLKNLLHILYQQHACSTLMVEAGPGLLGSMFDADLIDEAVVYIAPMMLGDELAKSVAVGRLAESLSAARRYSLWRIKRLDDDVELTYRRRP